jgi:hypothetical protein
MLGLLVAGTLAGCGVQDGAAPEGSAARTVDEAAVLQVERAVREAERAVRDFDRQVAGD